MLTIIIQNVDSLSLKTCLKICWNFLPWRHWNWESTNFKSVALWAKASTSVWAIIVLVEMGRLVEEWGFMAHAKSSSPQKLPAFKSPTLVFGCVWDLYYAFWNDLDPMDLGWVWFNFFKLSFEKVEFQKVHNEKVFFQKTECLVKTVKKCFFKKLSVWLALIKVVVWGVNYQKGQCIYKEVYFILKSILWNYFFLTNIS